MNILILFSQRWKVGGAETHVETLISGLSDHNIMLAVNIGSDPEKLKAMKHKYKNLDIMEIQARGANLFRWGSDLRKIAAVVRQKKIDVISAQQRTAGIWSFILHKLTGVPFVVTMHDPWHRAFGRRFFSLIFSSMIVVSRNLRDRLIDKYGFSPDVITLINNGIDFKNFPVLDKQAVRKKFGIGEDREIILHVSRLKSVKGAVSRILLQSAPLLRREHAKVKIIIIGEGPLRQEINEAAAEINHKYEDMIEVKDFTSEIGAWYNAADVVVGEGRVAIEALSCKTPVVAIRNSKHFIGVITESNLDQAIEANFDDNILEVTPQNLTAQIEAALRLSGAEREQIANSVRGRLNIETMSEAYETLLAEVKLHTRR